MSVELDGVNNVLKTDTISEVTSANGVTVDGLSIKDSKLVTADSVIEANMSANSVDSDSYVDGSIDTVHIADLNVTAGKIAADAITGAKIADDAINSEHYTDGSIDTAHIADNQITLAKMAGGTDGNIISYDASGDPVAIATGNDGQVLTSTGAGSAPAFETLSSGKLLQVQHVLITGTVTSITSSNFVTTEVTDIITPTAADSKILVMMNLSPGTYENSGVNNQFGAGIYRDINSGGFSRIYAAQGNVYGGFAGVSSGELTSNFPTTLIFVDSTHNSTAAITYTLYISQRGGDSTNTGSSAMERSVTLMEIGA